MRTPGPDDPSRRTGRAPTVGGFLVVIGVGGVVVAAFLAALVAVLSPASAPVEAATRSSVVAADRGFAVWDRNDDGSPVRWDPCSPIEVMLSPRHLPSGAVADLERALGMVSEASGLTFSFLGMTEERPSVDRAPHQPERYGERWAPVLVAWAGPGEAGLPLRDVDRGVSIPVAVGRHGDRSFVTGQVVLGAHRHGLVSGFEDRSRSWGATLVHELGHLVGLQHVNDPDEMMHVFPGQGAVELGTGDRAGLEAVGGQGRCREPIPPRPLEVPVVQQSRMSW